MRWLAAVVVFLLALGTLRMVGCGDEGPACLTGEDCDDQNECTSNWCFEGRCLNEPEGPQLPFARPCDFDGVEGLVGEDGICSEEGMCVPSPCDDSNDCTHDSGPSVYDGECIYYAETGPQPCDRNGSPGVCVDGVCLEYRCNDGVICDDGDPCTDERCDHTDWACLFRPHCLRRACNTVWCDPTDGSCHYTPDDGDSCHDYCILGHPQCSGGECVCAFGQRAVEVQP